MHARQARGLLLLTLMLCSSAALADTTGTVQLDPLASVITWTGKKVTGRHQGTVKLRSGRITLEKGQVSGGQVDVDMTTIRDEDLTDPEYNAKLVGHLKSADFFDVEKHPIATFTITEVRSLPASQLTTHELIGDLTIKGVTHPVHVPVLITMNDGKAHAKGTLAVDRTLWDIRYGSGKFFEHLGDKMIDDVFTLDLDLHGTY